MLNTVYLVQEEDKRPMKDWLLAKESELRIETFDDTSVEVQVVLCNLHVIKTDSKA